MSTEQNKEIARRFLHEQWDKRNIDILDELEARDQETTERHKAFTRYAYDIWSDIQTTVIHEVAEGDWVATEWLFEGTHQGEHLGVAPTGKRVEVEVMSMWRIVDGKVEYLHGIWDDLGVLELLDAPTPERPY